MYDAQLNNVSANNNISSFDVLLKIARKKNKKV